MAKAERIPIDSAYLYPGFERYIGFDGRPNAYGTVSVWDEANKKRVPVICGHGGSMWLCGSCADELIENEKDKQEGGGE